MYLQILKKDLKRKRTMNVILLLFIILATTFVSSSVNNIATVTNGLDHFMDEAGMSDFFAMTLNRAAEQDIQEVLDSSDAVESFGIEEFLIKESMSVSRQREEPGTDATIAIMACEDSQLNYYDVNDEVITSVEPGEAYVAIKWLEEFNYEIGDVVTINIGDKTREFTIAGGLKDVCLGSKMMNVVRFMVCRDDFNYFNSDEEIRQEYGGKMCYIFSGDDAAVTNLLSEAETGLLFSGSKDQVKVGYVMDMVISGTLLVISICLILIAFVVLRFTITFTLSEEYREIGVMKAIGIKERTIRGLYMVKYFALAVVGAAVGFLVSIPFGGMLLETVSSASMLGGGSSTLINLICSILVIVIIMMFCFGCTRQVQSFTPVEAIRSLTKGERFKKKGFMRLKKSSFKPRSFLALNDVTSSPRRFGLIVGVFALSLILLLVIDSTVATLSNSRLIKSFGFAESDVYMTYGDLLNNVSTGDGVETIEEYLSDVENEMAANNMPCECYCDLMLKLTIQNKEGNRAFKSVVYYGVNTTMDMYDYADGSAPSNPNEVAITPLVSETLGVYIGDKITIVHSFGEEEYTVTGYFQSMNNLGEGVRLHQTARVDPSQVAGYNAIQFKFTDNPSNQEIDSRIERMKEIFDNSKIRTGDDYVAKMVNVTGILSTVSRILLVVMVVIVVLVTTLMERSFSAKEIGEIAILKAIGFNNKTVINWHTRRFVIASVISVIVALALFYPVTIVSITPIFKMMGAFYGVNYVVRPLQTFVIYPLIMVAVTSAAAWGAALFTKTITPANATENE